MVDQPAIEGGIAPVVCDPVDLLQMIDVGSDVIDIPGEDGVDDDLWMEARDDRLCDGGGVLKRQGRQTEVVAVKGFPGF